MNIIVDRERFLETLNRVSTVVEKKSAAADSISSSFAD